MDIRLVMSRCIDNLRTSYLVFGFLKARTSGTIWNDGIVVRAGFWKLSRLADGTSKIHMTQRAFLQ